MNTGNEQFDNAPWEQIFTKQRAKRTGCIWEFARYGKEIGIGKLQYKRLKDKSEKGEAETEKLTPEQIRVKTRIRARKMLIDLVNCNVDAWLKHDGIPFPTAFLTLTYQENLQDIEIAMADFKNFIQRLNWVDDKTQKTHLKYLAVIEFQKRGAIHFHVVLFNMRFISKKTIRKIWGYGHIKVRKVDVVHNLGMYVTKYMVKNLDDERLKGHKSYLRSDGLKQPEIYYFEEVINQVKRMVPREAIDGQPRSFSSKYLRTIDIERYNLKNFPHESQDINDFLKAHV